MATTIPAPLAGKVAIVTGGSRGIGACIAEIFARDGCTHIAITYNNAAAKAEDTCAKIRAINQSIKTTTICAQVEDPEFGSKVVKAALEGLEVDHIDIAVSSAAIVDLAQFPPLATMSYEAWNKIITGECWAPLTLARAAAEHMPRGGRIIMLSSGSAKIASGDPFVSYAAGKAAMESVSKNMAVCYGLSKGITVNSIGVGATATEATEAVFAEFGEGFKKYAEDFSVLKRMGEASEVAEIVAFVASPKASWITANQIPANGGALAMLQG